MLSWHTVYHILFAVSLLVLVNAHDFDGHNGHNNGHNGHNNGHPNDYETDKDATTLNPIKKCEADYIAKHPVDDVTVRKAFCTADILAIGYFDERKTEKDNKIGFIPKVQENMKTFHVEGNHWTYVKPKKKNANGGMIVVQEMVSRKYMMDEGQGQGCAPAISHMMNNIGQKHKNYIIMAIRAKDSWGKNIFKISFVTTYNEQHFHILKKVAPGFSKKGNTCMNTPDSGNLMDDFEF